MKQRTSETRIEELQQKIEAIKQREARKQARQNPVAKQAVLALKALDKAIADAGDEGPMRAALDQARHGVAACVQIAGVVQAPAAKPVVETKARGRKRNNTATAMAS